MISIRYQLSMSNLTRTSDRIAELLVHIGRAARSEDARSDLTAAQWACLRFFASANTATRTPSGFARFQATTRGTASQIIKTLEQRDLIERQRCQQDRRSVRFALTAAGTETLSRDPLSDLSAVIAQIPSDRRDRLLDTLSQVGAGLAGLRAAPSFGTCRDCTHFSQDSDQCYCACMGAAPDTAEIDKLCQSHKRPLADTTNEGDEDGAT